MALALPTPVPPISALKKPPALARQMDWVSGRFDAPPVAPRQLDLALTAPQRIEFDDAVAIVVDENGSQLIVSGFGVSLGKRSERLVVRLRRKTLFELPFHDLQHVYVASRGVNLSSDLVRELALQGVKLIFSDSRGEPTAMLCSPTLTATVAVRRAQLAAEGNGRGIALARAFVSGKLKNQEKLLRYFAKGLRKSNGPLAREVASHADTLRKQRAGLRPRLPSDQRTARSILMGLEGAVGRVYWHGVAALVGERLSFPGRRGRGARDPLNSALNYGYGLLYSHVWSAVLNAGLEPFAGLLHVDRSGKPSFVLDLVEEFRQPVVDRAVLSGVRLGKPILVQDGRLDQESKEWIAQRTLDRLCSTEPHRGKRFEIRSIIQMQARSAGSFLRKKGSYRPFTFRW